MNWLVATLRSSIGKKLMMALTGLSFIGFLAVHLAGNLTLYAGSSAFNAYAEKLHSVGFRTLRATYNNFFVFPMAAALILLRRGTDQEPDLSSPHFDDDAYQVEMEPAPPALNAVLSGVTWSESQVLRWLNLPVGTSIISIAERPAS